MSVQACFTDFRKGYITYEGIQVIKVLHLQSPFYLSDISVQPMHRKIVVY